jgi:hypothetical protein
MRPTAVAAVPHGTEDILLTLYDRNSARSTCWVIDLEMAWRIAAAVAEAAEEVRVRLSRAQEALQAANAALDAYTPPAASPAPAAERGAATINAEFYR